MWISHLITYRKRLIPTWFKEFNVMLIFFTWHLIALTMLFFSPSSFALNFSLLLLPLTLFLPPPPSLSLSFLPSSLRIGLLRFNAVNVSEKIYASVDVCLCVRVNVVCFCSTSFTYIRMWKWKWNFEILADVLSSIAFENPKIHSYKIRVKAE